MALPSSGVMKASMIRAELGQTSGSWSINAPASRNLAKVPSGTIKFSDFYGKSNARSWTTTITMGYKEVSSNLGLRRRIMRMWGCGKVGSLNGTSCAAGACNPLIENLFVNMVSHEMVRLTPEGYFPCDGLIFSVGSYEGDKVPIPGNPKQLQVHIHENNLTFKLNEIPSTSSSFTKYTTNDQKIINQMDGICRSNGRSFTVTITEIKYYLISAFYSSFNVLREVI